MAGKEKHANRSSKTRNRSKAGMYKMNAHSEFLTQKRRKLKEMKENAGTS